MRTSWAVAAAIVLGSPGLAPARAEPPPRILSHANATQDVGFDLYLRLRHSAELDALLEAQQRPGSPQFHVWLTPAAFRTRFGADPAELARLTAELRAAGLTATVSGSHSLHVGGRVGAVEHAFATRLSHARFASGGERLVAEIPLTLPPGIVASGAIVAQFVPVDHMHRHSRVATEGVAQNRRGPTGSYWFDDLKQAYSFPSVAVANGRGATIGILMSGDYSVADMKSYFGHEKIVPPAIRTTQIYGGSPFSAGTSDETELDIQQSGGMALGANIVLFNLPDLADASVLAGLTTILETNSADIVNMSFGAAEIAYSASFNGGTDYTGFLAVYDDMFRQGNAQGISFVASSGDLGAYETPRVACFAVGATSSCGGYLLSVNTPASSPHVTAVGGTNLITTHAAVATDLTSTYVGENANPDTLASDIFYATPAVGGFWGSGGGISAYFAQPSFQNGVSKLSTTQRIVPDVALHMGGCPTGAVTPCGGGRSADFAVVGGKVIGLIGTSASSPDFAGLLALKVQLDGHRVGNVNPFLYALAKAQAGGAQPPVFHAAIPGKNGHFQSTPGYNAVLGNGTLFANAFLGVADQPVAGAPQSPSNP